MNKKQSLQKTGTEELHIQNSKKIAYLLDSIILYYTVTSYMTIVPTGFFF